jgi:hypothetical protein
LLVDPDAVEMLWIALFLCLICAPWLLPHSQIHRGKEFSKLAGEHNFQKTLEKFFHAQRDSSWGVTPARGIEKQTSSQRGGWDWQKTVVGGSGQVAPDRDFCSYADGDAERPVFVPGSSGKTPHEILEGG